MAGLTEAQLDEYLAAIKQWMLGKEHVTVQVSVRNGRFNATASDDTVLIQNGRILEQIPLQREA